MKIFKMTLFILFICSTGFADTTRYSISAYPLSSKQLMYFGDQKRNLELGIYMNFNPKIKYSDIDEDEDIVNFSWYILDEYEYIENFDSTVTLHMKYEDKYDYDYDFTFGFNCKKLFKSKQWTDRVSSRWFMGSSLGIVYKNSQFENSVTGDGYVYSVSSDSLWGYMYEQGATTYRTTTTTIFDSDIFIGVIGGIQCDYKLSENLFLVIDYQIDAGITTEFFSRDYKINFNEMVYGEEYPGNSKSASDLMNQSISLNVGPAYDTNSGFYSVTRIYNYLFRLKYTF